MVIGSFFKLEVGKEYSGLRDAEANLHSEQRYKVLSESTFDEWAKAEPLGNNFPIAKNQYYYLISTD